MSLTDPDEAMRERSGHVSDDRKLVCVLYRLMRDGTVAPGELETRVREAEWVAAECDKVRFTNGWLAQYAQDLADRLS